MMEENVRLARLQTRAEAKKPAFGLVAEISGIFSHLSSHDRSARKREKIRKDLVRIHFDTEPTTAESSNRAFVSQLGKVLRLD